MSSRRVRRAGCCPARRSCRSVRGQPGHGPPGARGAARRGPRRLPAGLRLVRGRRSGAPGPRPARHDRGQLAEAGIARAARSSTSASWPPRRGCAACSAPARARGAPPRPGRRRAVRAGHGVVPRAARRRAVAGRRRAVPVLRADRRRARRRGADDRRARPRRDDAELLGSHPASPVLRASGSPWTSTARPVLVSEHVFPAHLTEFVVDLPHADRSIAPSGLRLVE